MLNKIIFKNTTFNIIKTIDIYNPSLSGLALFELDGVGPVKANIGTVKGSFDGVKITSNYLEERNITCKLYYMDDYAPIETIRKEAYSLFKTGSRIDLTFVSDDVSRKISGVIESHESPMVSGNSFSELSIICDNPYMTDVNPTITSFYSIEPLFEFEFCDEDSPSLEFSELNKMKEHLIKYNGDAQTGFTITLFIGGIVKDILLYSANDKKKIQISNSMLSQEFKEFKDGDTIVINTSKKTITCIRSGKKYNILNSVGKSPSWFNLYPGDNIFAFESSDGEEYITIDCVYNAKYEGVI